MRVRDIMQRSAVSLPQNATLHEVIQRFVRNNLECLTVIDAAQRVVGVITLHDLIELFLPRYFELLRDYTALEDKGQLASLFDASFAGLDGGNERLILAADVMRGKLRWIRENDPVLEAASRLRTQACQRLPVVDPDQKMVGTIGESDIILSLLRGSTAHSART
jgi:CBS domain-containing membrane protein